MRDSDWSPRSKYRELVSLIQDLLENGEKRTSRDLYYALEARGHQYDYEEVARAVKKGRRAGYIDPSQIIDTSRSATTRVSEGWESPEDFVEDMVQGIWNSYYENFWNNQDTYVEVWLEKASLESVFDNICREYNVRLEATRGDWSDSKIYRATQRLGEKLQDGEDVKILYFGDFNPSGYHAPVAVQTTMAHYGLPIRDEKADSSDRKYYDISPWDGWVLENIDGSPSLNFERVALNVEHIQEYDLPENPTPSSSDKDRTIRDRFMTHVSGGQDVNVELNALKEYHRQEFEDMIEGAILDEVDEDQMEEDRQKVRDRQSELRDVISIDW
jgi:hypothetical protein